MNSGGPLQTGCFRFDGPFFGGHPWKTEPFRPERVIPIPAPMGIFTQLKIRTRLVCERRLGPHSWLIPSSAGS
jgi:hypothetical protein